MAHKSTASGSGKTAEGPREPKSTPVAPVRAEEKPSRKLELVVPKGESVLDASAVQAQDPVTKAAALATGGLLKPIFGDIDLTSSVRALQASVAEVQAGDMRQADRMLVAMANTLDNVFAECLRMWLANQFTNPTAAREYLQSALKTQSSARATWETISKIHNPIGSATFVKQANIANGPQQVNNGDSATSTRDGAGVRESANKPIELMEDGHGQRVE